MHELHWHLASQGLFRGGHSACEESCTWVTVSTTDLTTSITWHLGRPQVAMVNYVLLTV